MQLYISGSLAYDRIMDFDGKFADHILPDKLHVLNVCFNVNGLQEKLGGTAGNIAYGLAQLGERPLVLGCLGRDGERYRQWMKDHLVDDTYVRGIEEEFTAGAYITTDRADNQITGFNPGAMKHSCCFDVGLLDPADSLVIIAPGNYEDMTLLPARLRACGGSFIFDPGQALNTFKGPALIEAMRGARLLISNDYELEMITRMTGLDVPALLGLVGGIITTRGEAGGVLLERGRQRAFPAVPAREVKDPTGAGDAFRAGLMKGMAMGLDLLEACLWGAAIASYAVACYGTQEYALDQAEFQTRLTKARASWPRD